MFESNKLNPFEDEFLRTMLQTELSQTKFLSSPK